MINENFELDNITDELSRSAKHLFGDRLRKIILYGSYARGDYNKDSDLDIMILADIDESDKSTLETQICKIASSTSLEHDITVCILLRDEQVFNDRIPILPFYRNIATDGVEIYGVE